MKVCKLESCNVEFKPKSKRHYFCSEKCKYTHNNSTEKHKEILRAYNKSEAGRARSRKFLQTDKGKKYNREKSRRYRKNNTEKCVTRTLSWQKFPDNTCSVDGCNEVGERHHPIHSKAHRYKIVYLCKTHHMQEHHGSIAI